MQLTAATKMRAHHLGWDDDLIAKYEASVLREETVANLTLLNFAPDRALTFVTKVEAAPEQMKNLSFKFIRTRSEKGVRAVPGPHGLGTPEINIGSYGQVPDLWPYENDTPLGSHPDPAVYMPGSYHIYDKVEVWAPGVDQLYEDAIRERWIPATDLPWNTGLTQQPEELERAICQIATSYSSHGLIEQKIIAKWFEPISYGFHDVKLFLGTQVYDAGHKVEALRKRALANGGGLGQAPMGILYRGWYGALKFSEMIIGLDVLYKSYEVSMFEMAGDFAKTELDRKLFELMLRDSRRHLEYGKRHLLWYLQHKQNSRHFVEMWLGRAENALSQELRHTRGEKEALVVLFADGIERLSVGVEKLQTLRQKQLMDYLAILDSVGIDHLPAMNAGLQQIARDPLSV
ncbi:MAG: hypothetical protein ACKVVT_08460 [Dehalococcoidia bacterium]